MFRSALTIGCLLLLILVVQDIAGRKIIFGEIEPDSRKVFQAMWKRKIINPSTTNPYIFEIGDGDVRIIDSLNNC